MALPFAVAWVSTIATPEGGAFTSARQVQPLDASVPSASPSTTSAGGGEPGRRPDAAAPVQLAPDVFNKGKGVPRGPGPPPDTLGPPRPAPLSRAAQAALWASKLVPAGGPAESIGGYAAGCVRGAVQLPEKPTAYCFSHPERKRWFGHPALVTFLQRLATSAKSKKLTPLLVGDLSQARGGPAPTGHRSHQSGLDVDLGYVPAEPVEKGSSQAKNTSPGHVGPDVVDLAHERLTKLWSRHVRDLLVLAASDAAVDRLFVHPLIKRELCRNRSDDATWLNKVRPWWGHQDHFHVRLRCPAGSLACENQRAIEGDGCGEELSHWFKKKLPVKPSPPPTHVEPTAPRRDELVLPAACQAVLESVLPPASEVEGGAAGEPTKASEPAKTAERPKAGAATKTAEPAKASDLGATAEP